MNKSYRSFAEYLYDQYYNEFASQIRQFVVSNKEALCAEFDAFYVESDDFRIKGVSYRGIPRDYEIQFQASVDGCILYKSKGKRDVEENNYPIWLTVSCSAILFDGIHDFRILSVQRDIHKHNLCDNTLSPYLVPYLFADDLDKAAEEFLGHYYPKALEEPVPVDMNAVIENMHLAAYQAPLPENVFGKSYFAGADIEVFCEDMASTRIVRAEKGTILINPDVFFMRNIGSVNNTIIHECIHQDRHGLFFEMQRLLSGDEVSSAICCEVTQKPIKADEGLEEAYKWIEWQANALAPRILMPRTSSERKIREILTDLHFSFPEMLDAEIMQMAIQQYADFYHVSRAAAKIRFVQLGFDGAIGAFEYVDGSYIRPYSFKKGFLTEKQTFSIPVQDAAILRKTDASLSELTENGDYLFVENHFVYNTPAYVKMDESGCLALTDHARTHMHECCLVFDLRIITKVDKDYYSFCYLNREDYGFSYQPVFQKHLCYAPPEKQVAYRKNVMQDCMNIRTQMTDDPKQCFELVLKWCEISMAKLADMIGVDEKTIRRIKEEGECKKRSTMVRICLALNLPPMISSKLLAVYGCALRPTCYDDQWLQEVLSTMYMQPMEENLRWLKQFNVTV